MEGTPQSATARHPVLYAGRFADRVREDALPADCLVLDDWGALPGPLADAVEYASVIVVADALSFPFEALVGEARDVPLVLVLPGGRDATFLSAVLGGPVFGRLGFFDRVATDDETVWETLRVRYGWAGSQRIPVRTGDPARAAAEILDHIRTGDVPAKDIRAEKAAHRTRAAALLPRFAAARGFDADGAPMDVLQVGSGDGRWAGGFDPAGTRFFGVDEDPDAVVLAGKDFPGAGFGGFGPGLSVPHEDERFDLVFTSGVLGRHPGPEKEALISEMWRVARPGGRLLFLEDFVGGGDAAPHVVSIDDFVAVLTRATEGQIVLEHVQSVRYPGESSVRGGVIGVSRLGVPRRW